MKIKYRFFFSDGKRIGAYFVYCPACLRAHRFIVENEADPDHQWGYNMNPEAPTFSPSLLVDSGPLEPGGISEVCHSFLEDGIWKFQSDSTHAMAGLQVPMMDFPPNYRV